MDKRQTKGQKLNYTHKKGWRQKNPQNIRVGIKGNKVRVGKLVVFRITTLLGDHRCPTILSP